MGYTHYYNFKKSVGNFLPEIMKDIMHITDHYKEILAIETLTETEISLNGIADDEYETFYVTPDMTENNFCKTGRMPYDLPVCEILLILKHYYGDDFELSSDGFWVSKERFAKKELDGNWNIAIENVKTKFGYTFDLQPTISNSNGFQYYSFDLTVA